MDVSSVVVAAVSVIGTLSGAIVTSLIADRSRRHDFDRQRAERQEQFRHEDARASLLDRRRCYIAANVTGREYIGTLRGWAYPATRGQSEDLPSIAAVKEARLAWRTAYAEIQLITPRPVYITARPLNAALAEAYGVMMRLHERAGKDGDSAQAILALTDAAWTPVRDLREEMRVDLEVDAPDVSP